MWGDVQGNRALASRARSPRVTELPTRGCDDSGKLTGDPGLRVLMGGWSGAPSAWTARRPRAQEEGRCPASVALIAQVSSGRLTRSRGTFPTAKIPEAHQGPTL